MQKHLKQYMTSFLYSFNLKFSFKFIENNKNFKYFITACVLERF